MQCSVYSSVFLSVCSLQFNVQISFYVYFSRNFTAISTLNMMNKVFQDTLSKQFFIYVLLVVLREFIFLVIKRERQQTDRQHYSNSEKS